MKPTVLTSHTYRLELAGRVKTYTSNINLPKKSSIPVSLLCRDCTNTSDCGIFTTHSSGIRLHQQGNLNAYFLLLKLG